MSLRRFEVRVATRADVAEIAELIAASVCGLQPQYTAAQRGAAVATVFTVDSQPHCRRNLLCGQGERGSGWMRRVELSQDAVWRGSPYGAGGRGARSNGGTWEKLGGTGGSVEVDETFIGGKPKNMHTGRRLKMQVGENGYAEKAIVVGMLDRDTRQVRAKLVPNVKRETLRKEVLDRVGFGSTVYTDGWFGYDASSGLSSCMRR